MTAPARISPHVPRFTRDIRTRGILFGVPCYGGMIHDACLHGLLDTKEAFLKLGLPFNIITIRNESLIHRARNGIAARFLASGCDRLFFIDADIGFTAAQVLRMLSHDRDLIGGLYRKKNPDEVDYAVNFLASADGRARRDPQTGAVEVRHLATGFLCIKRHVVESMVEAFPHLIYRFGKAEPGAPEFGHGIFDCFTDPVTLEALSEDYAFTARWRTLGGELWADPGLILEHYGTLPLSADPMEHIAGGHALADLRAEGALPACPPSPTPPTRSSTTKTSARTRPIASAGRAAARRSA